MKNLLSNKFLIGLLLLSLALPGCKPSQPQADASGYFCPMHPTVESNTPGVCPVCNMELVPRRALGNAEGLSAEEQLAASYPTEKIQGSVKTIQGEYTKKNEVIAANGVIVADPRAIRIVSTRISGRIEKVSAAGEYYAIKQGQILATIYSPELVEAQRSFLEAKKQQNKAILESAKNRLMLLGLSEEISKQIEQGGNPFESTPIISPADGYLLTNPSMAPEPTKKSSGGMMEESQTIAAKEEKSKTLRSGDYVTAGQPLFYLLEKNRYQLEINIRESDLAKIKPGQKISGIAANGRKINGVIHLVEPAGLPDKTFRKARVYLNEAGLTIGMPVQTEITTDSEEGLWLPASAVSNLGNKKIVFLKKENYFIPTEVITGNKISGRIKIIRGLATSDKVAETAGFLVDSDAFISTETDQETITSKDSEINQKSPSGSEALMMDDRSVQLAGIKTAVVAKSNISRNIQLNGKIVSDPETRIVISSKIPGRIENMTIRETGKLIRPGMIIAEIHSPELITILSEIKMAVKQGEQEAGLATASRKKLLRYGFDESQISEWVHAEAIPQTIAIRTKFTGTVTEVNAQPGAGVDEGSPILTIENLNTLWVEAELYAGEEDFLKKGTEASITIPGTDNPTVIGTTEQILPSFQEDKQLTIARIRINNNKGLFRPGQIARVDIQTDKKMEVVIPAAAVLNSSEGQNVFVQSAVNTFEKRKINTGIHENGLVSVTNGLLAGERVVTSGAYLLESQIKLRPAKTGHEHH